MSTEHQIPEGFEEVSGSDVQGYFNRNVEGAWIQGKILKHKKFTDSKGEQREQFQISLTEDCPYVTTRVESGEWLPTELPAESVVGVDAVANIRCMGRYAGLPVEVWLAVEGKIKLPNGREAWQFKRAVRHLEPSGSDGIPHTAETEDLPF